MLIELILALAVGVLIGTFTGLFPGIHINLVSAFLLSVSTFLLTITTPLSLVIFIASLSITHTFIDFIPSIYLGAPNEDSFLSVLPGHKLLLRGQGHKAVIITSLGCLSGILIFLILAPLFLITREKGIYKKVLAFFVFILSGFLGIAVLNNPIIKEPLLPLL